MHPQLVKERFGELDLWRQLLPSSRYVGEVGLDAGPRFYSSFEQQKDVFKTILTDCAEQRSKILTVHSVRAAKIVLDMIEAHLPRSRGAVVLHWFTGSKAEAQRASRLGCYFSINREMLRNDRHRSMVSSLPLDRLLTETDGPFAKVDGRDSRPSDVSRTVEELAHFRAMPIWNSPRSSQETSSAWFRNDDIRIRTPAYDFNTTTLDTGKSNLPG